MGAPSSARQLPLHQIESQQQVEPVTIINSRVEGPGQLIHYWLNPPGTSGPVPTAASSLTSQTIQSVWDAERCDFRRTTGFSGHRLALSLCTTVRCWRRIPRSNQDHMWGSLHLTAFPPRNTSGRPEKLLTAQEVADWLGVSARWVLSHASGVDRPVLPSHKLGTAVRFDRTAVEEFIRQCARMNRCREV